MALRLLEQPPLPGDLGAHRAFALGDQARILGEVGGRHAGSGLVLDAGERGRAGEPLPERGEPTVGQRVERASLVVPGSLCAPTYPRRARRFGSA